MSSSRRFIDCLRLSEPLRAQLLAALEEDAAVATRDAGSSKRQFDRREFHGHSVCLTLFDKQDRESHFLACSRNLSASGLSLLHGGFVYTNTRCLVSLTTLTNELEHLKGRVARCRLVRGQIHELGIHFDETIDPRAFVPGYVPSDRELELVEHVPLRGRVLMLDDQEAERLLFAHHLKGTEAEAICTARSDEALETLQTSPVDVFVCDLALAPDEPRGEDVLRRARENGYAGPILALTGALSIERLRQCKENGADSVLLKPYSPKKLLQTLASLTSKSRVAGSGPIRSVLADTPETSALLAKYIAQIRDHGDRIRSHEANGESPEIAALCQTIQENAGGFGFQILAESARLLHDSINATASIDESRQELVRLYDVIARLTPEHTRRAA